MVERELSLLDQMQHGEDERELEDGLHGRVRVGIEVAVERGAGQGTGDGDFAVGVGGDGVDLLLEGLLREGGGGEEGKGQGEAHVVRVGRVWCGGNSEGGSGC